MKYEAGKKGVPTITDTGILRNSFVPLVFDPRNEIGVWLIF
jgi:hypothetical protein